MPSFIAGNKWYPIIPLVLGTAGVLVGLFLNLNIIQILWIVFSGLAVLISLLALILANVGGNSIDSLEQAAEINEKKEEPL